MAHMLRPRRLVSHGPAGFLPTTGVLRTLRWIAVAACLLAAAITLFVPASGGLMLVVTGLVGGSVAIAVAARSDWSGRWAWGLLGLSQLLNGIGNYSFLDLPGWWRPPAELVSWLFTGASIVMVLGLWVFISPSRGWRPITAFACDLLTINGCAFVLTWSLGLAEPLLHRKIDPHDVASVTGVVALVVDLLGVAMFGALLRSRPGLQKVPVMLAWLALVSALIGDNDVTTFMFRLDAPFTPAFMWSASSLLVLVGALFSSPREVQSYRWRGLSMFVLALIAVSLTALLTTWDMVRKDPLVTVIFTGVIVLLFLRCTMLVLGHRRLNLELARAALVDSLTGLSNRTAFQEAVRQRVEATGSATVLFCDLDGFKEINDTHGHWRGDELLVTLAGRLTHLVQGRGLVARMGGDEFTILMRYGLSEEAVHSLVTQLQAKVAEPIPLGDGTVSVSMAIGVAYEDPSDAEQILVHADLALYAAKGVGRSAAQTYEPVMRERMNHRFATAQRFREALAKGDFTFDYQPIVSLAQPARAHRLEALLRWWDVDGSAVLPPEEVIAMAEYLGEVQALTDYCVTTVVNQSARLRDAGEPAAVAINMSAQQLSLPGISERIEDALHRACLPAALLSVEVTEHTLLRSPAAVSTLNRLRALGIGIALDDFGTGFSNFSHLVDLPIDELKLDRSFTATDLGNRRRHVVLTSVVDLAHELGLRVTLEGVETVQQLELARSLGIDWGQGHLIGRPQALSAETSRVEHAELSDWVHETA